MEFVSLDGVMESPEEWAFSYSNDEMEEANASGMAASDALLLGRVTYEGLAAFWPNQPGGTPMVDYINSVPKYVVSGTLEEPLEWNNSTLIKGDVAEGIAELKRQPGKDITTIGSGALCPVAATGQTPRRAEAHGPPHSLGDRQAPLRGRGRAAGVGARGLEDVRHGRGGPHLRAGPRLGRHLIHRSVWKGCSPQFGCPVRLLGFLH